ncbi:hypothetical protein HYX70_03885 [Candidatus Saccharibacteria bacterium]|nr:hypothetical protein [Candidatus Saccharibacteria bacterium]
MSLSSRIKITTATVGAGLGVAIAGAAHAANPDVSQGANSAQGSLSSVPLTTQVAQITNTLLIVIGVVAVIMLIVGGFRYIFSQGDEKQVKGAKDTILFSIIGIVVALLAYAIVNFVLGQFS